MKRVVVFGVVLFCLAVFMPAASAQSSDRNHGEFGVFFDYTRLAFTDLNLYGVGGRVGFNAYPAVSFEAEMAYDFEQSTSTTVIGATGSTIVRSRLTLIHGLFGPKVQTTKGPLRVFVTVKGGLLNFGVSPGPATPAAFANRIGNIQNGDTNGVFYPGGGVELNAGPFGIRVDVGDEIYFDNGANHNLKITGGPIIRF